MLANLWYSVGTVDKLTRSFKILAVLLARLMGRSARWKVVDSNIHTAWMYDCAPMIAICGWEEILSSKLLLLDSGSSEVMDTIEVLEKLVLLCEFNWKVINLVNH